MTAYDMRISDWSSYVCSSDLVEALAAAAKRIEYRQRLRVRARTQFHELHDQLRHLTGQREVRADQGFEQRIGAAFIEFVDLAQHRSAERRVGEEWVSTCSARGSPWH